MLLWHVDLILQKPSSQAKLGKLWYIFSSCWPQPLHQSIMAAVVQCVSGTTLLLLLLPPPHPCLLSTQPALNKQLAAGWAAPSMCRTVAPCTICSHTMSSADKASSKKGLWGKACSVIKIVRTIHHNIYNIISSISFVVMSLMIKKSYEEFIFRE